MALACASPAAAQLSGDIAFRTDDRFRGHSLSEGRPTLSLDLSYDHPSGLYLDLVVHAVDSLHDGPQLLGAEENFGYARRIRPDLSIDLGVTNSDYTEYYNGLRAAHYQEYYVGVIIKRVSVHLHYSPRYFGLPVGTLYGDVDGALPLDKRWRLTGHFGVLQQVAGATLDGAGRTHYDYRIGTVATFGPVDLQLEWTGGWGGRDYYANQTRGKNALVFGAAFKF